MDDRLLQTILSITHWFVFFVFVNELTSLPWMIGLFSQFSQSLTVFFNELTLLPWMIVLCSQFYQSLTGTSISLLGSSFA
jgi:hypothetical protein